MSSDSESDEYMPPAKKTRQKRSRSWTDDETHCLIEAWKKYASMEKDICSKLPFREKIVQHLKNNNFKDWNEKQVGKRMENLRNEFRKKINPSTGSAGKPWPFRQELCEILRDDYFTPDPKKFRESATPVSAESITTNTTITTDGDGDSDVTLTPLESVRSKKSGKEKLGSSRKLLELFERDVTAKEKMAIQAEEIRFLQLLLHLPDDLICFFAS